MDDRALAKERFLLLIDQLTDELGTERKAALRAKTDPSYPRKLRESPTRWVGLDQIARTRAALHLRKEFFTDSAAGDRPDYKRFVLGSGGGERVERDEETLLAVEEFVAGLDGDELEEYREHDQDWGKGLAFKDLRSTLGVEVTPSLIRRLWSERRGQRSGKIRAAQRAEVEVPADKLHLPRVGKGKRK